jgi:enoyl-CoA hydratase
MKQEDNILFSVNEGIGLLQLNRPQVLNALDRQMYLELEGKLAAAAADDQVRVVIFAGRGRAFCAGTDIGGLEGATVEAAQELALVENGAFNAIEDFPKPTLAALHGYALGGGCELALACDYRVVADDTFLGQPEIDMGWLPAAGATFRLPALVGRARAWEMMATGRRIDAAEAERIGLVQRVVAADALMAEVMELGRGLAQQDPQLLLRLKEVLKGGGERKEAVEREAQCLAQFATAAPAQQKIRAFLKRK